MATSTPSSPSASSYHAFLRSEDRQRDADARSDARSSQSAARKVGSQMRREAALQGRAARIFHQTPRTFSVRGARADRRAALRQRSLPRSGGPDRSSGGVQVLRIKARKRYDPALVRHVIGGQRDETAREVTDPVVVLIDERVEAEGAVADHREDRRVNKRKGRPPKECVELLLAGPPPYHSPDVWDRERELAWAEQSVRWVRKLLGPETHIAAAALHRDETSPHIHVLAVPILDGRIGWSNVKDKAVRELCPKKGRKSKYSAFQDLYHREVAAGYGLGRGEIGSEEEHKPIDRLMAVEAAIWVAEAEAEARRSQAVDDVERITAEGRAQAAEIKEAARTDAAQVTADARAEAVRLADGTRAAVERYKADVAAEADRRKAEADRRVVEAAAEADRRKAEAAADAERRTAEAAAAAERIRLEAEAEAERVKAEGVRERDQALTEAQALAAGDLALAEKKGIFRTSVSHEGRRIREDLEAKAAAARTETERVQAQLEEERRRLEEERLQRVSEREQREAAEQGIRDAEAQAAARLKRELAAHKAQAQEDREKALVEQRAAHEADVRKVRHERDVALSHQQTAQSWADDAERRKADALFEVQELKEQVGTLERLRRQGVSRVAEDVLRVLVGTRAGGVHLLALLKPGSPWLSKALLHARTTGVYLGERIFDDPAAPDRSAERGVDPGSGP